LLPHAKDGYPMKLREILDRIPEPTDAEIDALVGRLDDEHHWRGPFAELGELLDGPVAKIALKAAVKAARKAKKKGVK